jgi:SAM-dependent methyltransferase
MNWNNETIRTVERSSIREFVLGAMPLTRETGSVLDYGCGKQPYREIIEDAGCRYTGYDRAAFPGNVSEDDIGAEDVLGREKWDAILCTQILQYVPDVPRLLMRFRAALAPEGVLILTYATNWDEVEPTDLHRFTFAGIERLLETTGYEVLRHDRRAEIDLNGFRFPLGGGVIASHA